MKSILTAWVLFLCMISAFFSGCIRSNDGPPTPDTPEPDPLNGVYAGEGLTLSFNGDGKTVTVTEAELLEPGDYEYVFLFDSFGQCRRDVATLLRLIRNGETAYQFRFTPSGEDALHFYYNAPDGSTISYSLSPAA